MTDLANEPPNQGYFRDTLAAHVPRAFVSNLKALLTRTDSAKVWISSLFADGVSPGFAPVHIEKIRCR